MLFSSSTKQGLNSSSPKKATRVGNSNRVLSTAGEAPGGTGARWSTGWVSFSAGVGFSTGGGSLPDPPSVGLSPDSPCFMCSHHPKAARQSTAVPAAARTTSRLIAGLRWQEDPPRQDDTKEHLIRGCVLVCTPGNTRPT